MYNPDITSLDEPAVAVPVAPETVISDSAEIADSKAVVAAWIAVNSQDWEYHQPMERPSGIYFNHLKEIN